jgi:glycosyltransferase involved in cell wall biosynthesis
MVSILIPTFNSHATFGETLASIDSRRDVQIIVTDDCSTQAPMLDLLDQLEASGHLVVRSPTNMGPGAALQRATKLADGKYLLQLDSDDKLAPGALDAMIDALEADESLDAVWGDAQCFGAAAHRKAAVPALDLWHILHANGMNCSTLIRRTAHERAGGWSVARPGIHDWGMMIALALTGARGRHVGRVTLHYRVRTESVMHSSRARYAERRRATLDAFPVSRRRRLQAWLRSEAPLSLRICLPLALALPGDAFRRQRRAKAAVSLLWMHDVGAAKARLAEARPNWLGGVS